MTKFIQIMVENHYCDVCGEDLESYNGHPYYSEDGKDYCLDCAYKAKIITKREWAESHGILLSDRALKHIEVS